MKLKKVFAIVTTSLLVLSLTACGGNDDNSKNDSEKTNSYGLSQSNPMIVDKDKKEIKMLCEVNGTYFSEPSRHGIVYKDGSNGEKAILRGLADEKEFYQALIDLDIKPGNNLTAKDMKAGANNGKSIEGEKLAAFVEWDGQEAIPFADIVKTEKEKPMDLRFGGNIESAKKNNTGCVLCLDSCATGIVSDAAWPTGTTQNNVAKFYGDDSILPDDGTQVTVTFRLAE